MAVGYYIGTFLIALMHAYGGLATLRSAVYESIKQRLAAFPPHLRKLLLFCLLLRDHAVRLQIHPALLPFASFRLSYPHCCLRIQAECLLVGCHIPIPIIVC
jgi:hypothetical protein